MKRICLFLTILFIGLFIKPCFATSYGDLYDIEWCPCDTTESFNEGGSVVLGKTVMCPCDSMYGGYGRTLKKDSQKVKQAAQKVADKVSNYKYYIGIDFNKSNVETKNDKVEFNNAEFDNPLSVNSGDIIDDQDNIGIVLGMRPHPNMGIEAFYNRTMNENEITRHNTTAFNNIRHLVSSYVSKYQAFGVDLIGYLPVTDYFDFIAFAGLGQYYFENSVTHKVAAGTAGVVSGNPYVNILSSDFDDEVLAWRVGGGFQFNIGRGVILRAMYRYINIDSDFIKELQEFSLGVRFVF